MAAYKERLLFLVPLCWILVGNVFQPLMEKADFTNLDLQCNILQLPFTAHLVTLLLSLRLCGWTIDSFENSYIVN